MLRKHARKVPADQLYVATDPQTLGFDRTDRAGSAELFHGQTRAQEAFRLAAESPHLGFNAFVGLPPGYPLGKSLSNALGPHAAKRPVPPDLVCINNFQAIDKPKVVQADSGAGPKLASELEIALHQLMEGMRNGQIQTAKEASDFFVHTVGPGEAEDDPLADYLRSAAEDMETGFLAQVTFDSLSDDTAAAQLAAVLRVRYGINVLVSHDGAEQAPVIDDEMQTLAGLFGDIDEEVLERVRGLGPCHAVKAGAIHRAQGGYIVCALEDLPRGAFLPFTRLLAEKKLWFPKLRPCAPLCEIPTAMRAIWSSRSVPFGFLSTVSFSFGQAFKITAQFEDQIQRTEDTTTHMARLIARFAEDELDLPLEAAAVARLIEHSARLAQDSRNLDLDFDELGDIMREANTYAHLRLDAATGAADVKKAITQRVERSNAFREYEHERILEDRRLVETSGTRVGQVNGLSIITYAQKDFSLPKRITARVRLGEGDVVQIHREVGLSSVSHEKGALTMEGYLMAQYGQDMPFALNATVNFEQNFSFTSGDSSSSTQLYALVSAISGVPIKQGIAVTGTMDQVGNVQAIGGVNLKIEGFFDVCRKRGLDGSHGVLIPQANVRDLMLREDIIDAVEAGKFSVYAVDTIDQGLEVLTGLRAGTRNRRGQFPRGSVNWRVEDRIRHYAEKRKFFGLRRWI